MLALLYLNIYTNYIKYINNIILRFLTEVSMTERKYNFRISNDGLFIENFIEIICRL